MRRKRLSSLSPSGRGGSYSRDGQASERYSVSDEPRERERPWRQNVGRSRRSPAPKQQQLQQQQQPPTRPRGNPAMEWLAGLVSLTTDQFAQVQPLFVEHEIETLADVGMLARQDLIDMGIASVGLRNRLLRGIALLPARFKPPAAPAVVAAARAALAAPVAPAVPVAPAAPAVPVAPVAPAVPVAPVAPPPVPTPATPTPPQPTKANQRKQVPARAPPPQRVEVHVEEEKKLDLFVPTVRYNRCCYGETGKNSRNTVVVSLGRVGIRNGVGVWNHLFREHGIGGDGTAANPNAVANHVLFDEQEQGVFRPRALFVGPAEDAADPVWTPLHSSSLHQRVDTVVLQGDGLTEELLWPSIAYGAAKDQLTEAARKQLELCDSFGGYVFDGDAMDATHAAVEVLGQSAMAFWQLDAPSQNLMHRIFNFNLLRADPDRDSAMCLYDVAGLQNVASAAGLSPADLYSYMLAQVLLAPHDAVARDSRVPLVPSVAFMKPGGKLDLDSGAALLGEALSTPSLLLSGVEDTGVISPFAPTLYDIGANDKKEAAKVGDEGDEGDEGDDEDDSLAMPYDDWDFQSVSAILRGRFARSLPSSLGPYFYQHGPHFGEWDTDFDKFKRPLMYSHGWSCSLEARAPPALGNKDNFSPPAAAVVLAARRGLDHRLQSLTDAFTVYFRQKAGVHMYTAEGMDEMEMTEAECMWNDTITYSKFRKLCVTDDDDDDEDEI